MKKEQSDITIFMTDQWNPRCVGYAGAASVRTPAIDSLAAEGVAFSAAYTGQSGLYAGAGVVPEWIVPA
jgi:arylsulfatase A-like enzyme